MERRWLKERRGNNLSNETSSIRKLLRGRIRGTSVESTSQEKKGERGDV